MSWCAIIRCFFRRIFGKSTPVECWLARHSRIASYIRWETSTGILGYWSWSRTQKRELEKAYLLARQGNTIAPVDPIPNLANPADTDPPITVLPSREAWLEYIAYLAQTLYLEINHRVSWSVISYPAGIATMLFDSKYFFEWNSGYGGYSIPHWTPPNYSGEWFDRGHSLSSQPNYVYDFLQSNNLIGSSRIDTIGRVVEWCRQNLHHFAGPVQTGNFESHWFYRGYPPVFRIIEGTPRPGPTPDTTIHHWTAGCSGTNGFLNDILKSVNIPVVYHVPEGAGHAVPYFITEGLYLSHGDDPYTTFTRGDPPPYPALEMLIDQAQYDAWFGPLVPPADRQKNVGRKVGELALVYLTPYLLRLHCNDLAAGRDHAASTLAQAFSQWYTVSQLESMNLWQNIEAKIASLGGCGNVPYF